jgi:hypothetical protein
MIKLARAHMRLRSLPAPIQEYCVTSREPVDALKSADAARCGCQNPNNSRIGGYATEQLRTCAVPAFPTGVGREPTRGVP